MSAAAKAANLPVSTGLEKNPVLAAAQWLATGGRDKSRAAVPQIREKFDLCPKGACEAIREANLIRARAL